MIEVVIDGFLIRKFGGYCFYHGFFSSVLTPTPLSTRSEKKNNSVVDCERREQTVADCAAPRFPSFQVYLFHQLTVYRSNNPESMDGMESGQDRAGAATVTRIRACGLLTVSFLIHVLHQKYTAPLPLL